MGGGGFVDTLQGMQKWVQSTGASTTNLGKDVGNMGSIFGSATTKMADMGPVAQQLGDIMNAALASAISKASLNASGFYTATANLTTVLKNNAAGSPATVSAMDQVTAAWNRAQGMEGVLTAQTQKNATTTASTHGYRQQITNDILKLGDVLPPVNSSLAQNSLAIIKNGVNANQQRGARAQLIADIEAIGAKAKLTTSQMAGMISKILNIPKSEAFQLLMNAKGQYSISGGVFPTPGGKAPTTPIGELTPVRQAVGGLIGGPGGPSDDKVPAWLSAGEYVVRAASVDKYGKHLFDALNAQKFAAGGFAQTGDASVFSGQYPYSAIDSFETTVASQLAGATLAALHKAQVAAAASGGGGYAGPGGGNASANEALARSLFPFGSSQWQDFVNIAMRESGFSNTAMNPSGAYGIAQALPSSKYPLAGRPPSEGGSSNPTAQITWMFDYIRSVYGTPANAWSHEQSAGWYDKGGLLMPGVTTAVNTTGRPETVLPNSGGINITFNGSQWPGPEQIQAFTLALTSAIAHA
jgi:hypothetical protein